MTESRAKIDRAMIVAGRPFPSRLIMGTGKFCSAEVMKRGARCRVKKIPSSSQGQPVMRISINDNSNQYAGLPVLG
ncbi:MAG TPA: hypothetical protein VEJ88_00110 [Dissulfurispiraceae bacterium]|nr:hypothetical protein [Dissulfurispiraceae bacterium]